MRLLFIGETWQGSSASSMRWALQLQPNVLIDEIGEDHYIPKHRSRTLRAFNRALRPLQRNDLKREILERVKRIRPDLVVVYKGANVSSDTIQALSAIGLPTVNIFPDLAPNAHGIHLKHAMGAYDLVISTKANHPAIWKSVFGYTNRCVFVPHGYDPYIHYWADPPRDQDIDVVLAATWRPEYHQLLIDLADILNEKSLKISIAGNGWNTHRHEFPANWSFQQAISGRSYSAWLRRGRIAISPVQSNMLVSGQTLPADEDTTRSYELAAAGCFFIHRRTPYIKTIYNESTEVPMWSDAAELAALVTKYLPLSEERRIMASRAHTRAVPEYCILTRAQQIVEHLQKLLSSSR